MHHSIYELYYRDKKKIENKDGETRLYLDSILVPLAYGHTHRNHLAKGATYFRGNLLYNLI